MKEAEITQEEVDAMLKPGCDGLNVSETPVAIAQILQLQEQNAVLLNVIKDYQHMLYQQSTFIAQLVSDGQEMVEGTIH